MSWRERMGSATFRRVPFFIENADRSGGRRAVRHEYPLRDEPFIEDMGRRARSFPVEGYVVGDEYLSARDALIAALETAGPGEFIHPHYGKLSVICDLFRVRESSAAGGMARFAIDFHETKSSPVAPTATVAAPDLVDARRAAIVASIRARLAARKTVSMPAAAYESLSAVISSAAKTLDDALAPVVSATQELASMRRNLAALVLDATSLARTPSAVLDGFLGAFISLGEALDPRLLVGALLAAIGFVPSVARPPATTATRIREQGDYDLLLWLVRTLMVVEASRFAAAASFDSYDSAAAARDAITGRLDEQLDGADDDTFAALEQLRADLVRAVPGEESDLPRLMRYTPAYTVPSLVLAHRLYGDLSREADLVTRNSVPRPGFVRGGLELEVLSA